MIRLSEKHARKRFKKRSKKGKNIPTSIPMPGEETDKQVTIACLPRKAPKNKHKPSPLCYEAAMNDPESELVAELEKAMEETEAEVETRKPKAAIFTNLEEMDAYVGYPFWLITLFFIIF